jgi:hypothetical protein
VTGYTQLMVNDPGSRAESIWFNLAFWQRRPSITFGNNHGSGSSRGRLKFPIA